MLLLLATMMGAYVGGSVNFSILLLRALKHQDPRRQGSSNPGATNVYRLSGPLWAAVVLLLDTGRAASLAFLGLYLLSPHTVPWVGLALILGNRFPCFHGFSGGKGVANYLGFSAVLCPLAAALAVVCWASLFVLLRTPFISSFLMVAVLAAGAIIRTGLEPGSVAATGLTVAVIIWAHGPNMKGERTRRTNPPT